jgi:hypothetical protein
MVQINAIIADIIVDNIGVNRNAVIIIIVKNVDPINLNSSIYAEPITRTDPTKHTINQASSPFL